MRGRDKAILGVLLVFCLAGCGRVDLAAAPQARKAGPALQAPAGRPVEADWRKGGIPKDFVVVMGEVVDLLPPDTRGLPHQIFVIRTLEPEPGAILEVNHNVAAGRPVDRLEPGMRVVVRGVLYSGHKDGIHWTHHAARPGDAGFIQTEDGQLYE